jgi:putative FmdB family regulatory protein
MPSYDYHCNNCHRRVNLRFKTYAEYDQATPVCPNCASTNLTILIGRVTIAKSDDRRFDELAADGNEAAFDDMADADPVTLGRYMRKMGNAMGEDMGEEFNEVVNRLEHGEDPDSIESSMEGPGDPGGGMDMMGGMGGLGGMMGGAPDLADFGSDFGSDDL